MNSKMSMRWNRYICTAILTETAKFEVTLTVELPKTMFGVEVLAKTHKIRAIISKRYFALEIWYIKC